MESPSTAQPVRKERLPHLFLIIAIIFYETSTKEVDEWTYDLAVEISQRPDKNEIDPTAWRVLARKWMKQNRMNVIRKQQKVSPNLNRNLC